MDKINNLLEKADKAAEKLVNKIEDEVDKSLDPPVVPMSTGTPTQSNNYRFLHFFI